MSIVRDLNNFVRTVKKLIAVRDYSKASVLLKDKLVEEPEVSVYQLFFFEVLIKLNKYKEARFWLKKFIAKCKSQADVYYYKGLYYFLAGKISQSMESLENCFNEEIYYLKKLFTDDTFDALKETKEFKELIAPTKEFQVNEFISLKLVFSKILIYICDELFLTCQKVALSLAPSKFKEYSDFDDIDEIIDFYQSKYDPKGEVMITPEEEFWAHSSNMQAWVDNNYNTCILSKNLSFPILAELSKRKIPYYKILFKEELITRIRDGGIKTLLYFINENYLRYLSEEDLFSGLLSVEEADILRRISNLNPYQYTLTTNLKDSRRFPSLRDDDKIHFCVENNHVTELEIVTEQFSFSHQYHNVMLKIRNLNYLRELAIYDSIGDFIEVLYNFDSLEDVL